MSKINLVMIEDNKDLCDIVITHIRLKHSGFFDSIEVAHDGGTGCALVFEKMPDVVLIDIVLPAKSGLEVLKKIKQSPLTKHIICIMVSSINSDAILNEALELGADYYIPKPFQIDNLIERILYLYSFSPNKPINTVGKDIKELAAILSADDFALFALQKSGVPMNLNGYSYLQGAIVMSIEDGNLLNSITKELYPRVGAAFQTTGSRVERSIRNAIECAWAAGGGERYYKFIDYRPPDNVFEKPTNGAFIGSIVSLYNEHRRKH